MALCVTKYFSFCFSLLLKEEQSLKAIPLEKHILLAEHNGYLSPRQCPSRLCATDSSRRERFVLNSQLANFARGGLWGSGEWSTGQKLGESIHNNCPGKLREAGMWDEPFTPFRQGWAVRMYMSLSCQAVTSLVTQGPSPSLLSGWFWRQPLLFSWWSSWCNLSRDWRAVNSRGHDVPAQSLSRNMKIKQSLWFWVAS